MLTIRRTATSIRWFALFLLSVTVLTGCYTYTRAPGAIGKVVDADTEVPIRGALVIRPYIPHSAGKVGVPPEGIAAATAVTDKHGSFNLPPELHTQMMFMYLRNPDSMSGTFLVSAGGYATNEVQGQANSHGYWRADLGKAFIKKQ